MTFEEWLEKEFGPISVYDFDTSGGMERWVGEMRKAFEAGRDNSKELADLRWRIEGLER